jgi:hypothetical protein
MATLASGADFEVIRSTTGNGWEVFDASAGAAMAAGDLVALQADDYFDKVADEAARVDAITLSDASAQGDAIKVVWWAPTIIVRGVMSGTIGVVGGLVGINVTSNVITFETNTELVHGRIVNIVDADDKIVDVLPIYRFVS